MRARVCAFLLVCLFTNAVPASASTSVIVRSSVPSDTLGRPIKYQVYLPDGYDQGSKPLPVLYLLHGAGGNEMSWMKLGRIKDTVDNLIATKAIPPVIIVMPGCANYWWVDGPQFKSESALWQDFLPAIERQYRTQ